MLALPAAFVKKYAAKAYIIMMNKIWLFMMLASLLVLLFVDPGATLSTMIDASTGALTLCIELCAVYAVWLGLLEIVDATGLGKKLAKLLRPLIRKLFRVNNEEIEKMIALNMSANMLGLGNAATPMGIKAMQALDDGSGKATFSMIMLVVVNATSIQLLPSTVIGLRANAGSADPADIILPTILATIVTVSIGISLVILCDKIKKKLARRKR